MSNRQSTRYSALKFIFLAGLLFALVLSACSAAGPKIQDEVPLAPSATLKEPDSTPTPEATENPFGDWLEYTNEGLGFRYLYPSSWYGPDVYESEGSLRLEVGSDVVYPYGTSREDQVNTVPNSYYITIQYFENIQGRTWDDFINSGWIDTYLGLLELEDGESITTVRSLTIRVREVSLGDFQGLEHIATLSDTAQTERGYMREIMAFDKNLNWLRITGSPNLVEITDPENWKDDYRRVDQANLELFHTLADSIIIK
ncbi:MAG: hypothetical protein J7L35_00170 [Anaerolineales bacterium]|nr:hypothetical protein [Anaerolineales bacterium]